MEEKKKNRREWIKNVAIVFLIIMLILTFFSNTIMNYSLPEVATDYVQPDTITAKIRGSGTIESVDPYNVMATEARKVSSVAVRVGDSIQQGDIICYLDDTESDELKEARKVLKEAKEAYYKELLSKESNITDDVLTEYDKKISYLTYREELTEAQKEVEEANDKVNSINKKIEALTGNTTSSQGQEGDSSDTSTISLESVTTQTTESANLKNAKNDVTAKQNAYDKLANEVTNLQNKYDLAKESEATVSQGNPTTIYEELVKKKGALYEAEANLNAAKATLATVQANEDQSNLTASTNLNNNLYDLNKQLLAATDTLNQKQSALDELYATISGVFDLQDKYDAISDASETVALLEEKSIGATITSDVTGTITTLNVSAGTTIDPSTPVCVIQPADKGYLLSFTVTNEQAKRLSKGTVADVVNDWRYDDVEVTLTNIKNDPQNPGKNKILEFEVKGDVTANEQISVSVGDKTSNYDLVVPNSAIREDNNGKFILIVNEKSSPLGNRYIAERVDVEVLASDDTKSAISGALYGYEFVITTTNKPVEAGKQVRLANN